MFSNNKETIYIFVTVSAFVFLWILSRIFDKFVP